MVTGDTNVQHRDLGFPFGSPCRSMLKSWSPGKGKQKGRTTRSLRPWASPAWLGIPSPCLTWMVLPRALQPLGCVHADIVLGVDDLSIQDGEGPATAPRGEGQEVRGLGGGPTKEAAQRHGRTHVSILRALGPRQGLSGPAGAGEETTVRGMDIGLRPARDRTSSITVAFGCCWHGALAELWGRAVQPPQAQPTTGLWRLSTVLSHSSPHHLGSGASTRLGCQQALSCFKNQGGGKRRRRKRRRERKGWSAVEGAPYSLGM